MSVQTMFRVRVRIVCGNRSRYEVIHQIVLEFSPARILEHMVHKACVGKGGGGGVVTIYSKLLKKAM